MRHIDFEALKYADFEVINSDPTPEEFRQISAILKKHREEQALLDSSAMPRSKKAQPLVAAARKNVRAAGE